MRWMAGTANVVFLVSLAILVVLVGCSKDDSFVPPVDTPEGDTYVAFEVHRNGLAVTAATYTSPSDPDIEEALIAVGLDGRGLLYPNDNFATPLILQSAADFHGIAYLKDYYVLVCGGREGGAAVVRGYFGDGWMNITHSALGNFTAVSNEFLCSDAGEILESRSQSTVLELVFQAPVGVRFNGIFGSRSPAFPDVIAVGDDGAIFHRYASGEFVDESVPGGPDFIAITACSGSSDPLEALAVSRNEIWQFRDGIWSRVYDNAGVTLNDIRYLRLLDRSALAVGNGGLILRCDGVDWTVEALGDDVDLVAIALSPDYGETWRLDLCGSRGEVYRGGEGHWRNLHHHASGPWSAFHTSSGTRYAANGNKLMRFEMGDWVEEAVWEWGEDIVAFHVVDPTQIWALGEMSGGFDHYVLFYDGNDWMMIRQSSLDDFSAIWCDAAGDNVFVAADHGQIFWRHDGLWELAVDLGTSDAFHHLAGPDMESLLAVGDAGLIMRRGPSGWSDESYGTTNALRAISGPIIAGEGGTILRQANGAWQVVSLEFDGRFNGVWYGADGNIWAVGDDASVMHYDGIEWTRLLTHLPGIDFLSVTGIGVDKVWIGGSEGYLLRSPELGDGSLTVP